MSVKLHNSTVIITGASEGIGREVAILAAAAGARTILVARNRTKLEAVARGLEGMHKPEIFDVDLSDAMALAKFIGELTARGIVPDVLINNAGSGASGAFVDDNWPKIDAMLRLNMLTLARLSHWAGQAMKNRGRGSIVNISAAVATRPTPYFGAYAASKAFVTSLSQAMAAELRGSGVTVSVIHPPAVKTSFAESGNADLKSTLVLKLFPAVSAVSVARSTLKAAVKGTRSKVVGPIAGIIMATAPIMPRGLDLAFMSLLFKGKPRMAEKTGSMPMKKTA